MIYPPAFHNHTAATTVVQIANVVSGFAYTISTMSRSSVKNSISRFPFVGGMDKRGGGGTPSRTPRLMMETGFLVSSDRSSGAFHKEGAA